MVAYATHLFSTTISLNNWWADPYSVIKTLDGGTAFAGQGNGYYVIKMDSMGNIQWAANYGLGVRVNCHCQYSLKLLIAVILFPTMDPKNKWVAIAWGPTLARIDKNGNLLFAKQDASNPFVMIYCSSLKIFREPILSNFCRGLPNQCKLH